MLPNPPSSPYKPAIDHNHYIYTPPLLSSSSNLQHQRENIKHPPNQLPLLLSELKMECNGLISKNLTNPREKNPTKPISLLEGEENFFNRIVSRDSSKGFSSRIYYRVAGKVPFAWEVQPGTPKIMPESEPLPPLSPPPAMQRLSVAHRPANKGSTQSRLWFWKKIKVTKAQKSGNQRQTGLEESFESWSYGGYSTWSSSPSRSYSSSSSMSSSFGSPMPAAAAKWPGPEGGKRVKDLRKRRGTEGLVWAWSCSPWRFSGVLHG